MTGAAAIPEPAPTPARAGEGLGTIGPYTVARLLGRGGMGAVFHGRDPAGADLAIKLIDPTLFDEAGRARFDREGAALARLPAHEGVVGIRGSGEHGGWPYLVLDLVKGESLQQALRQGPLTVRRSVELGIGLARACAHIHHQGVLHRDLKPANVIVRAPDGKPVIIDFGLAALGGAARLTRTGEMVGTPQYMAPEQALGLRDEIDQRTDVHALGLILYELLTGRSAFTGTTPVEVLTHVAGAERPRVRASRPEVDEELDAIVHRAMASERTARTPSADKLAAELSAWLARKDAPTAESIPQVAPTSSRSPVASGLGVLVPVGILGALAWLGLGRPGLTGAAPAPATPAPLASAAAAPVHGPTADERRAKLAKAALLEAAATCDAGKLARALDAPLAAPDDDLPPALERGVESLRAAKRWNELARTCALVGERRLPRSASFDAAAARALDEALAAFTGKGLADDGLRLVIARGRLGLGFKDAATGNLVLDSFFSPTGPLRTKVRDASLWASFWVAMVRLDVDIDVAHLEELGNRAPTEAEEPTDDAVRFFVLRLREANRPPRFKDLKLESLVDSKELGPRTRAHCLTGVRTKNAAERLKNLERAVERDPDSAVRRFQLAAELKAQGRKAQALAAFKKALELHDRGLAGFMQYDDWIRNGIAELEKP